MKTIYYCIRLFGLKNTLMFILKIMHKRDMKAEANYWGDIDEETVCKMQGW